MMKKVLYSICFLLLIILNCVFVFAQQDISDWAISEVEEAKEIQLIENDLQWNFKENINRQEFAHVIVSLYKILKGNVIYESSSPFIDVDDIFVSTAYKLGILNGIGNQRFNPKDDITREQMAVMIHSLINILYVENTLDNQNFNQFRDKNSISPWASDSVKFITSKNIIQGDGNNFFPNKYVSRELAVIAAKRVAKNYIAEYGLPLKVMINGCSYDFAGNPRYDGNHIWIPGTELMSLLDMTEVWNSEEYLCGHYIDENHNHINMHFGVGAKEYFIDTNKGIGIISDVAPYRLNGDTYITEEMIESVFGDFISYENDTDTVKITLTQKNILSAQANKENFIHTLDFKNDDNLEDTRLGSFVWGITKIPAKNWIEWSERLKSDGYTRAKITINFLDSPAVDFKCSDIEKELPSEYVEIYNYLHDIGIMTTYTLSYWDMEYRNSGGKISHDRLSNQGELDRYLDYVKMVVTTLKGKVDRYELWNEPDVLYDYYQRIRPEDYINMARQAIPVIKEIDPNAEVVWACTASYIEKECQEYTKVLLSSDIVKQVDGISLHSVNNDSSPVFRKEYYYDYDTMWDGIKKLAKKNGFQGYYLADELNYRSFYSLILQPEQGSYHPYESEIAAKYIARMIAINRGMDISVGLSGNNSYERIREGIVIKNMGYLMDGFEVAEIPVKVESENKVRHYTFKDRDNNHYIAVWNDGAAKILDKGIEGKITIANTICDYAVVLDPYNSTIQELDFVKDGDNIIIDNFILRDYPVFIKL